MVAANTFEVREERPEDIAGIRRVNEAAFGQPGEAALVDALRQAGGVTLSLVALAEGEVIGHILFSPVVIRRSPRSAVAVGLAPMAVSPGSQKSGVGAVLIRTALERLREAGHAAVVVLGHPSYYPRFGFQRASRFALRWEHEAPDDAFMALELQPGALSGPPGIVAYRPEFDGV